MNETLEELLEHFFGINEVSIFNEEEFVEDVWKEDKIPTKWLQLEVKEWNYSYWDNMLIVKI